MGPAQSCIDMRGWGVFDCLYAPTMHEAVAREVRALRVQLRRMQRTQAEHEKRDRAACREIEQLATGGSAFAAREKAKAGACRPRGPLLSCARRNFTFYASITFECANAHGTTPPRSEHRSAKRGAWGAVRPPVM